MHICLVVQLPVIETRACVSYNYGGSVIELPIGRMSSRHLQYLSILYMGSVLSQSFISFTILGR